MRAIRRRDYIPPYGKKSPAAKLKAIEPPRKPTIAMGGLRFADPVVATLPAEKPKRKARPKVKNDPKLIAAAREFRDRYLDEVNGRGGLLIAPGGGEVRGGADGDAGDSVW